MTFPITIWRCEVCRRLYMSNLKSIIIHGIQNCSRCYSRFTKEELKKIAKVF